MKVTGTIVAADVTEKTITIQCDWGIKGVTMGSRVTLSDEGIFRGHIDPNRFIRNDDPDYERQPGE